jgi:tetratricopeptide (TPR) repeat protein
MKQRIGSIALFFLVACVSPVAAEGHDQWETCRNAPVRRCVLDEAVDLLNLLDPTPGRAALLVSIAETRAQAGDVASAAALARNTSAGDSSRLVLLRAVAAGQVRTGHQREAAETFDQALQVAYAIKDPLQRAEALDKIAKDQVTSGFAAAAEVTYDQTLQAAQAVRIVADEQGQIPTPEQRLARLLKELALRQAAMGQLAQALETARGIRYDLVTRTATFVALADLALRAGGRMDAVAVLGEAVDAAEREGSGGEPWPSLVADSHMRILHGDSGYISLLCDIAKAQARAGLTAEAAHAFEQAAQAVPNMPGYKPFGREWSGVFELAGIADAEHEAGFDVVAQATLARAAALAELVPDRWQLETRARIAESQVRLGLSAAAATTIALVREEAAVHASAYELAGIAAVHARAGRDDEAATMFAEALAMARAADEGRRGHWLTSIADAQEKVGLLDSAATTFGEALANPPHDSSHTRSSGLINMIYSIARDDPRGARVVAASPDLRRRLIDATQEIDDRLIRAQLLNAIARAMPD